jgi:hypothetical protein
MSSIYIPRIAAHHDEESIRNVMANYNIGTVSHVDFTPINKKPGFGEKVDDVVKSAFVHFYNAFMKDDKYSRPTLENNEFWYTVLHSDEPYKLQVSLREYWLCLKNTKPVQRTMMNIHQVVENGRHLENLIEEQAKTIEDQSYKIEELSKKLDNVTQVVYQLLGGLFNQSSQCDTLRQHIDVLYTGKIQGRGRHDDPNDSNWEDFPTTRQGDDSERRIEALEQTVREMLQFEAVFTPQEDGEEQDSQLQARKFEPYRIPTDEELFEKDSDSTHSSMPGLIDIDSVSSHSSMPDLEEVSVDSEERIRNSFELCGNE